MSTLWNPAIPSLGFTVDTPLGPVDLVAVARARAGHPVELTEAELTWLALEVGYVDDARDPLAMDERRRIAEAFGLTTAQVSARLTYRLHREGQTSKAA